MGGSVKELARVNGGNDKEFNNTRQQKARRSGLFV
jgi:hypothetical protein